MATRELAAVQQAGKPGAWVNPTLRSASAWVSSGACVRAGACIVAQWRRQAHLIRSCMARTDGYKGTVGCWELGRRDGGAPPEVCMTSGAGLLRLRQQKQGVGWGGVGVRAGAKAAVPGAGCAWWYRQGVSEATLWKGGRLKGVLGGGPCLRACPWQGASGRQGWGGLDGT